MPTKTPKYSGPYSRQSAPSRHLAAACARLIQDEAPRLGLLRGMEVDAQYHVDVLLRPSGPRGGGWVITGRDESCVYGPPIYGAPLGATEEEAIASIDRLLYGAPRR